MTWESFRKRVRRLKLRLSFGELLQKNFGKLQVRIMFLQVMWHIITNYGGKRWLLSFSGFLQNWDSCYTK